LLRAHIKRYGRAAFLRPAPRGGVAMAELGGCATDVARGAGRGVAVLLKI
jgi:hypothetical protein